MSIWHDNHNEFFLAVFIFLYRLHAKQLRGYLSEILINIIIDYCFKCGIISPATRQRGKHPVLVEAACSFSCLFFLHVSHKVQN